MLPLQTEAAIEEKTIVQTSAILHTIKDYKFFNKVWIYAWRQTIIHTGGEEETGKFEMVRGPLGQCHLLQSQ